MMTRRIFIQAGSLWLAGLALPRWGQRADGNETIETAGATIEIVMRSDSSGAWVAFDPIGVLARPGQRIRWINDGHNVHTATAYHPANGGYALRIPAAAEPWDSGYLVKPGERFEVVLGTEGVYDYFCKPHESAGMVGRIIIAGAGHVSPRIVTPYPDEPENSESKKIPAAALQHFPSIESILKAGRVAARPGP